MLRSIVIFPQFANGAVLDSLRKKYDPLAEQIRPHLTLVFPFESSLSNSALEQHIRTCLADVTSFPLRLQGITGAAGGYLFVNVKQGNDSVIELHDRLYSGVLREFLTRKLTYFPHLTVGRITDEELFEQALEETAVVDEIFETLVTRVTVELIDDEENSVVQFEVPLNLYKFLRNF